MFMMRVLLQFLEVFAFAVFLCGMLMMRVLRCMLLMRVHVSCQCDVFISCALAVYSSAVVMSPVSEFSLV